VYTRRPTRANQTETAVRARPQGIESSTALPRVGQLDTGPLPTSRLTTDAPLTDAIVLARSAPSSVAARNGVLHALAVPTLVVAAVAPLLIGQPFVVAVLGVIGAGILIAMATVPVRVALLVVVLVPVTSGIRRGLIVPGLRLSEVLVALGVGIVVGLPMPSIKRWSSLDHAVLTFGLASLVLPLFDIVVITDRAPTFADVQTIFGPIQFVLIYVVTSAALGAPEYQIRAQRGLLLASTPVSVLAIAETLGPPPVHDFLVSITGTGAFVTKGFTTQLRAASIFPIWLALAGYLLVILLLGISLLLAGATDVLPPWALTVVVGLGALALAATLTITVIAMLVLGALYLGWRHGRLVKVGALVAGLLILGFIAMRPQIEARLEQQSVPASTQREAPAWLPETIGYRLVIWQEQYVPLIQKYAPTGYGPDLPPEVTWAHTESGYITLLLRGGVPLLSVSAVLVVALVRRARREVDAAVTGSRVALCETAGLLAILQIPINLTFPYFTASGMPQAMWVVWGLLAATQSPVRGKRIRIRGIGGSAPRPKALPVSGAAL
jgi:hypothetical protein